MYRNHLLLAIDRTVSGQAAVDFTIGHASASGAKVTVLHVRALSSVSRVPPLETAGVARQVVEYAVTALREAEVPTVGLICSAREDAVARRIVEVATEQQCSGIVLGSLRLRGLRRLTGQGVRGRVLRTSHLPVIVAPPAFVCSPRRLSAEVSHAGHRTS